MTKSFSAQVDAWVQKTEKRIEAVFKESTQRVIADAQLPRNKGGRMRVDTGFLRASGQASLDGLPTIREDKPGKGKTYRPEPVALVINNAKVGDTIYFGWSANYAWPREMGAKGQPPDAFLRGAAQKWQKIVSQVVREAKARS